MLFYIVALVFGILLVAYVSYLVFNIIFDMAKGNEPQNTFFPFFKTKKPLAAAEKVVDKLNESKAELATSDENVQEKETEQVENPVLTDAQQEEIAQEETSEPVTETNTIDTSVKAREPKKYN